MVNVALEHLEENKGSDGLYMTDRTQAYKEVAHKVNKSYPRRQVTVVQCRKQLQRLCTHERRIEYQDDEADRMDLLCIEGRKILNPDCDRENLLQRAKEGKLGVRSRAHLPVSAQNDSDGSSERNSSSSYHSPQRDPTSTPGAESYDLRHDLFKPTASNINSARTDGLETARDFLAIPPDRFLPSRKYLEQLKESTVNGIRSSAYEFLDCTGANACLIPQLYDSLRSPSFLKSCSLVYNASSKDELLEKYAELQSTQSALTLPDFLRALMSAVLTDRVFKEDHSAFATELFERSTPQSLYEDIVAESETRILVLWLHPVADIFLVHPELHKQLLRKRNHDYMQQFDFGLLAPQLVHHFVDDLIPFINSNVEGRARMNLTRWRNGLQYLFIAALEFRAQVMLLGGDYEFRMAHTDDPFDRKSMVTEYGQSPKDGKVHVTLFRLWCT